MEKTKGLCQECKTEQDAFTLHGILFVEGHHLSNNVDCGDGKPDMVICGGSYLSAARSRSPEGGCL